MNKICTSIEQSRKLIELGINIGTADMYLDYDVQKHEDYPMVMDEQFDEFCTPAWSLNSLLSIIKNRQDCNKVEFFSNNASKWALATTYYDSVWKEKEIVAEYPIDAAFEMVCWLLEKEILPSDKN